eukprot:1181538-Prorocentrum_minimum.AAC.1
MTRTHRGLVKTPLSRKRVCPRPPMECCSRDWVCKKARAPRQQNQPGPGMLGLGGASSYR